MLLLLHLEVQALCLEQKINNNEKVRIFSGFFCFGEKKKFDLTDTFYLKKLKYFVMLSGVLRISLCGTAELPDMVCIRSGNISYLCQASEKNNKFKAFVRIYDILLLCFTSLRITNKETALGKINSLPNPNFYNKKAQAFRLEL